MESFPRNLVYYRLLLLLLLLLSNIIPILYQLLNYWSLSFTILIVSVFTVTISLATRMPPRQPSGTTAATIASVGPGGIPLPILPTATIVYVTSDGP